MNLNDVFLLIYFCCNIFYYYIFLYIINYYPWFNLMILFNSILLSKFGQQFNESCQFYNWKLCQKYRNFNNKYLIRFNVSSYDAKIMVLNINSTRLTNDSNLSVKKNNFVYRNFWQKMINDYFKETVFVSSSNRISHNYINKLKSLNLSIYNTNEYKKFLNKFSKDLAKGKIHVELNRIKDSNFYFPRQKNHVFLKYTWSKLFNIKAISLFNFKDNKSDSLKDNMLDLSKTALPLFIVINSNEEIVVSESNNQLVGNNIFSDIYNHFTKSSNLNKKSYTGLFFVNYDDALEYKNYIQLKYPSSTCTIDMRVVPTTVNLYSQLMMIKNNNMEFRLIPDLKEISNLIYHYKKYKNIKFSNNQKYGRNFFQGQPLYFIKPLSVNKRGNKNIVKLSYYHYFKDKNLGLKYYPAFLNYNTLISAWQKFRKDNPDYRLPYKPMISISNLETFMKYNNQGDNSNTIFLPSYETYDVIKSYLYENFRYKKDLKYWIASKSLYYKTLFMRFFWSLTSRQPINW